MSADNNYNEILEKVCNKLNQIDSVNDLDLLGIKNSVESIENVIIDTQAKLNFQEIKEKLENIQNAQNLSLASAEFEEFQKQHLDITLKTNTAQSESLKKLDDQLSNLHKTLISYVEHIATKVDKTPDMDEMSSLLTDMASIGQKNILQTNSLIKNIEANFSEFKNKEFTEQISKISEIYDSLNIIHAWIEKVGFLNKSIENVYARLGANIDFDDVSEKVDIIYDNISALNNWTMKIDNIDGNMADMQSKVASLSSCIEDTKNITEAINSIKSKFDSSFANDVDLEDLSNKMDIVYDNLNALNEWSQKVDTISENLINLNDKLEKNESDPEIQSISQVVTSINNAFEEEMLCSKIDLIYDNISVLNEWVSKIDDIAQKSEELDGKLNTTNNNFKDKVEEITQILTNAGSIIEDVPNIKDKLEDLSKELNIITRTTKNETESYIYTLLDIESDFLKLHKFLDDKTEKTTQDINSLKERFEELNDDISSISKRTNKLILSADDANKEFRMQLEVFKNAILELDIQRQEFNPELKFNALGQKLSVISKLLQNTLNANRNLNNAFVYLAEWVDTTDNTLKNIKNDLNDIKQASTKKEAGDGLKKLLESFEAYKNDDVSELKSLLTGIIVQLNTALSPDIDAVSEKIEKLSEESNNKFSELELLMKEKIEQQSKQILSLEEKIETMSSKFDKLIEAMSEDSHNYEVKDLLNYLATQMSAANDNIANQSNILASFDNNINKIVSYIEEE